MRLVVPWKYGFKSIKSDSQDSASSATASRFWELAAKEYGFYSNVNPDVSHPRWSQGVNAIGEFSQT